MAMQVEGTGALLHPPGLQHISGVDTEMFKDAETMNIDSAHPDINLEDVMDTSSVPHTPVFVYSSEAPDYSMSVIQELTDAVEAQINRSFALLTNTYLVTATDDYLEGVLKNLTVSGADSDSVTPVCGTSPVSAGLGVVSLVENRPTGVQDPASSVQSVLGGQYLFSLDAASKNPLVDSGNCFGIVNIDTHLPLADAVYFLVDPYQGSPVTSFADATTDTEFSDDESYRPTSPLARKGKGAGFHILRYSKATQFKAGRAERKVRRLRAVDEHR
jgi:hypothetical protein